MPVVNLLATLTQLGPGAVITALSVSVLPKESEHIGPHLNVLLQNKNETLINLMLKLSLNEIYWKTLLVFSHIFLKSDSSRTLFVPKQQ